MASTDLPATDLRPTLIQQIAGNVLSVAAAAIPLEVVEHTKALIFDSIGCALAATEEPAYARASRVLVQLGGNPDCTGANKRSNPLLAFYVANEMYERQSREADVHDRLWRWYLRDYRGRS